MAAVRRDGKPPPFTEWHGNTYRGKVRIPEGLRFLFPVKERGKPRATTAFKRFLYKDLGTCDRNEAAEAANAFVAKARRLFTRMGCQGSNPDELRPEAQRWRKAIEADPNSIPSSPIDLQATIPMTLEELEALETDPIYSEFDALVDRATDLQWELGHARTMVFFNIASGKTRPINEAIEDWLRSTEYSTATQKRYRKVVETLADWCVARRIPPMIEAIDPKRAHSFLARKPNSVRRDKATANERATLSRLWQWSNAKLASDLRSKIEGHEDWIGDLGENPWRKIGAQVSSNAKPHWNE